MVLFHCEHQEFVTKSEIRSTKHETNLKSEFLNVQNANTEKDLSPVSIIWILVIRICLRFRNSDFGFTLAMCFCGEIKIYFPLGIKGL